MAHFDDLMETLATMLTGSLTGIIDAQTKKQNADRALNFAKIAIRLSESKLSEDDLRVKEIIKFALDEVHAVATAAMESTVAVPVDEIREFLATMTADQENALNAELEKLTANGPVSDLQTREVVNLFRKAQKKIRSNN